MHLPLPNELLHWIIKYIAYNVELTMVPDFDCTGPRFQFHRPSPELLALSVANWQLRRVCLPFLFARIKISHDDDAQELEEHFALFAKFIKTLVLGASGDLTRVGQQIISENLLPQIKQLFDVELGDSFNRTDLLTNILAHPTVTSILVDELPHVSMCNHDLSKVIYDCPGSRSPFSPTEYYDRGMRLKWISFDDAFRYNQLQILHSLGLEVFEIFLGNGPIPFPWLSRFLSTHPKLNEIWLIKMNRNSFFDDAPPFLSSLVEIVQQQDLRYPSRIINVGLRRPIGQCSQEWDVMELTLLPSHTIHEDLSLFACSFPTLEILTLDLDSNLGTYDIGNLSSDLARFPSLRVVYFNDLLGQLPFQSEIEKMMRSQQFDTPHTPHEIRVRAERELLAFTSCLAKQVRTLDSVYIEDIGHGYDDHGNHIQLWCFQGWLRVLNSDRVVGGSLA
ncbi:hypothetical protein FB446DRAFT_771954 [Lentinula raphanica]|nr:hypothetical protein FB446DRAFT_771954 [Lentinula raphanica]